jgi:hypothetical protein
VRSPAPAAATSAPSRGQKRADSPILNRRSGKYSVDFIYIIVLPALNSSVLQTFYFTSSLGEFGNASPQTATKIETVTALKRTRNRSERRTQKINELTQERIGKISGRALENENGRQAWAGGRPRILVSRRELERVNPSR